MNRRRRVFTAVLAAAALTRVGAQSTPAPVRAPSAKAGTMQIHIIAGDGTIDATLADSPTARDFAALLPLEMTLEDYAATEKIATLPRRLSTAGAPAGIDPEVGDLAYYAPWGNLAIFHKGFRYSSGLIRLGRITSGIEILAVKDSIRVRIEAA